MYLNVEPPPAVPQVRGLGRLGQVRLIAPPGLRIPPGTTPIQLGRAIRARRGLGQSGCPGSLADEMQSWLASLSAENPTDAAVGCGASGGAPCGSPAEAAAMAGTIAENFCNLAATVAGEFPGCTVDPACANPAAAVASIQQQALQLFNSFPASVWSTEAANAASGEYYGPIGTETGPAANAGCGPGGNGLYVTGNNETAQCPNGSWAEGPNGMVWTYAPPGPGQTLPTNAPITPVAVPTPVYGPSIQLGGGGGGGGGSQSSGGGPGGGTSGGTTQVSLVNNSSPGAPFQAGDAFTLTVQGPANAAVTGSSSQNGGPSSLSSFGNTNSSGQLTITGTWSSGDQGTWTETWQVAGANPTNLNFTVAAPTAPGTTPAGQSPVTSAPQPSAGTSLDLSWLSNNVNLFGVSIPVWGLLAAGAGLLILMPKKL